MAGSDSAPESGDYFIELSKNPICFDPVSKVNNVFFDDANRQVFAVRSGGATGVVVKGPSEKYDSSFCMEDKGNVISIKFSPDLKVLAIQRSHKSVEFLNIGEGMDVLEYSQSCKGKNTKVLGCCWTALNEIVFVTDHGIEYYQVIPEKQTLKSLKTQSVIVNWFVYLPDGALLISSGNLGNVLHPFVFKPGIMTRLPKFEVDLPVLPKPAKLCLFERDVTVASIYGQVYIVILRQQSRGLGSPCAEVVLYQLQRESPAKKTDVLKLDMSGRFAVNVVDNLIVVHHQSSKTSMIFDIRLEGEFDRFITYHYPVTPPLPIKPFVLKVANRSAKIPQPMQEPYEDNVELYSPTWVVFQPNIIIDAKLGCLWYLHLRLEPLVRMISDKCRLIDLLLLRQDSKMAILTVCKQGLSPGQQCHLLVIAKIFDKLNQVYHNYLESESQTPQEDPNTLKLGSLKKGSGQAVIDQSDMYTHVFSIFIDNKDIKYQFMIAVLIEYIRSLNHFLIPVQHYLYELVINMLVHQNCFYQLHQFLQYHVLSDSKPLACLMLSLESVYPPAHQLALDMLKRLSTANEEIVEVLLSKHQILTAIRFVRSVGSIDTVSARKFLEAAKITNDNMLFYTVFMFFQQRNIRLKGNPSFGKGEHCESYVNHFETLFGPESLLQSSAS